MAPAIPCVALGVTLGLGLATGGTIWGTKTYWAPDRRPTPAAARFLGGAASAVEPPPAANSTRQLRDAGDDPDLMIFGLYNTGTNAMQALLHAFYPSASICPNTRNFKGPNTCKGTQPSKHMNPERLRMFLQDNANRNRHVILMVRDPFSNVLAAVRDPYQLANCWAESQPDWLTRPCKCSKISRPDPLCEEDRDSYSSIVALWSNYAQGTLSLSKRSWRGRTGRIIVVRYEDFMTDPQSTVNRIVSVLGLPASDANVDVPAVMRQPTKAGDLPYDKKVSSIQTKAYLQSYSKPQLKSICQQLDLAVTRELSYGGECQNSE